MRRLAPAAPVALQTATAQGEMATPRRTLADRLRAEIADEILSGQIAPGAALDEVELARRFGVSRTPVREAIRLLAAGGLVKARPHRSAIVARPGRTELLSMFEALKELEAICAGLAAERMTQAELSQLAGLNDKLLTVVSQGDAQRYHEINEQFHAAIYDGSHNTYLAEITRATRERIAPFSRVQFRTSGRLVSSYQEHERIVAALLRHDRELANEVMRAHIVRVHESYAEARPGT